MLTESGRYSLLLRLHDRLFAARSEEENLARDNRQNNPVIHREAIMHLKNAATTVTAIIASVGPFHMQFGEPTFHSLAESILYQQLNGKAAATIFDRFTALAGDPLTPKGILKLTDAEMRGVGLSRQKTAYLRDLSEKTAAGLLEFERLPELPEEEVIAHLTQVKIGRAHV